MVRDYRIKEWRFEGSGLTPTSGTDLSWKLFTSGPGGREDTFNGEIINIEYNSNDVGSIYLCVSGTNELIWYNNAASGTAGPTVVYPVVYNVDNSNTSISGTAYSSVTRRIVHSPLYVGGSGAEGGSIGHFVVHYR